VSWDRGVGDRVSFQGAAGRVVARRRTKGHNGMVDEWSDLGFVVPRQSPDGASTFWVEVDRDPYAALRDRDYFHIMMNLENNAEFLPKAKSLAEDFLAQARQLQIDVAVEDDLKPFRYDPRAFSARLDKIYGALLDAGNAYNPATDQVFNTREAVVELIRQTAPFNQTDGAWLREVGEVGPIDQVHSLLFSVLADETGNGDPRLNHANLFTDLLHSVGVFPPDIRSREYVDDPELLDSAFTLPLFQMVISQFSENYFAEILGMTLYLEWEVLGLTPIVKMMEFHGVDAHFYRMHIAIDNAAEGHGARAKRAVQLYLEQVRNESGEDAAQHQWRRIWDGYVTFKTTGTVGSDLVGKILNRTTPPLANQVAAMMARKKPYGQLNHDGKRLGDNLINDLFEDPGTFMNALQAAGMIVPGDVANSPFFKLLTWDGPMYKVFTDAEIQLWKDWTESLAEPGPEPAPGPDPTVLELMVRLIETMRNRQEGTGGHQANQLTGPDPANPGQTTTQPVAFWFRQPTPLFMQALANPDNGWIVPGNAAASRFVNELLRGDRPMGRALSGVAPGTSHRTWRSVAIDWINAGCPIPTDQLMLTLAPVLRDEGEVRTMAASRPVRHLTVVTPLEEVAANPQGRILGLGTVH
jgi:hypothetical protein